MNIIIDPDIRDFLPPLSKKSFADLEAKLQEDGCREALVVWKGKSILIDGHHRYRICIENDIPFSIVEYEFEDIDDVKRWIITNQDGRRNLHPNEAAYYTGKLYELEKKQQGGLRNPDGANQYTDERSSGNNYHLTKTEEKVAKLTGESPKTVRNHHKFTQAIDALAKELNEPVLPLIRVHTSKKDWISLAEELDFDREGVKEVVTAIQKGKTAGKQAFRERKKAKMDKAVVDTTVEIEEVDGDKVELGDVWQLGKHLLYCMDSSLWRPEELATMAFADPPYNVGVADWDKGFVWDHDWLEEFADYVLVTPGNSQISDFIKTTQMKYRWMLNCDLPGVYGRKSAIGTSNTLPVLLFSQLVSVHRGISDRYSCTYNQKEKQESSHPGRKPKALIGWLIESFTSPGNLVIDPFLGSGTTLLMAEALDRVCHGAELNPVYCAEIIARWEAMTGKKAAKASNNSLNYCSENS